MTTTQPGPIRDRGATERNNRLQSSPAWDRWFRRLATRRVFQVYQYDLGAREIPAPVAPDGVEFCADTARAVSVMQAAPEEYDLDARLLRDLNRQVREGELCFSGWVGGTLAFYGWAQFAYRQLARLTRLSLPAGKAFIYRCFTHPRFRGRGIYPAALGYAGVLLKARGLRQVFIDHAVDNWASARGITKWGAQPCGRYTVDRVLGVSWARVEPAVQRAIEGGTER